jgi:hypothetical protein
MTMQVQHGLENNRSCVATTRGSRVFTAPEGEQPGCDWLIYSFNETATSYTWGGDGGENMPSNKFYLEWSGNGENKYIRAGSGFHASRQRFSPCANFRQSRGEAKMARPIRT